MQQNDEALVESIYGELGSDEAEGCEFGRHLTVDGGDYDSLVEAFLPLMKMGVEPTSDDFFVAPATNTSFTFH